jgi:serine protease Do
MLVFAVPVFLAAGTLLTAQPGTPAQKGFLGVAVVPAKPTGEGVLIREVTAKSPAEKAGIKEGDVVVKLDGKDVAGPFEFIRSLGEKKPGDKLELKVQRGGKEETIAAVLGERIAPPAQAPSLSDRIRDLEKRLEALEKRLESLDKKAPPPKD